MSNTADGRLMKVRRSYTDKIYFLFETKDER